MFNPGGLSAPPLIIFAPFLIYLLVSLISIDQRKPAIIAMLTMLFDEYLEFEEYLFPEYFKNDYPKEFRIEDIKIDAKL
jgi:hypothetical protein